MRGAEKRVSVHPLFAALLLLSAFTGRLLLVLSALFAALEHELAHALVARKFGYRLNKIVLMPYGAVISGDIRGIPPLQEIQVCLAGPLANAVTALLFAALWWLYPESYPYTDLAAQASLSLFLVNLLPAFPLDGGRILRVLLRRLGEKRQTVICRTVGLIIAASLLGAFVFSCFSRPNFGLLAFSLLLLAGEWGGAQYGRLTFLPKDLSRGVEERRIVLSARKTVGEAMRYLSEQKYLVLVLYEGNEFLGELSEEELIGELTSGAYQKTLKQCLSL